MNGPTFAPAPVHAIAPPAPRPPARPPARPAAAKPADDSAAALRVMTYLRLHWLMILFCGGLLGAGLAYAAWNLLPPKFESYAVLQAASAPTPIGGGADPTAGRTEFATFMKTQSQLLKFNFVLESALSDPEFKIASLATLAGQKNPIKFLDEKLVVNYTEGAETIRVLLEGDQPDDIRKIVDAVVKAYKREVIDTEARQKRNLQQKVAEAKVKIEEEMKLRGQGKPEYIKGAIPSALMQAAATVPNAMPGGDPAVQPAVAFAPAAGEHEHLKKAKYSVATQKYLQLDGQLKTLPLTIRDRRAELDDLNRQIAELQNAPPPPDVIEAANKDQEVLAALSAAAHYDREARFLEKTVVNPKGAKVAQAKESAEAASADWVRLRDRKAHAAMLARNLPKEEKLREGVKRLTRELESLAEREKVARAEFEDAKKDVIDMPADLKKAAELSSLVDPLRTEMLTQDAAYQQVTAQAIRLSFEPPERMTVRQPASAPRCRRTAKSKSSARSWPP
jgi:succinoglycan biosynthesis transport protein ExoP